MKNRIANSLLSASLALAGLIASGSTLADPGYHGNAHYAHNRPHERVVVRQTVVVHQSSDYAPVLAARPIYRQVAIQIPADSCRVETVAYRERSGDSFGGTVVGGLIGAAIGHELGNGRGQATAAGGLIGAAIGNNIAAGGSHVSYGDRQVCETRYRTEYENRLVGYDVSYSYYGRVYHTETREHPGARIRVDVDVRPH